jgi:hypothetical protein
MSEQYLRAAEKSVEKTSVCNAAAIVVGQKVVAIRDCRAKSPFKD